MGFGAMNENCGTDNEKNSLQGALAHVGNVGIKVKLLVQSFGGAGTIVIQS
jgi:hypothetical protein